MRGNLQIFKNLACSPEALHVSNNKISDYSAKEISQAVAQNKSLVHIDMTYNDIKDFGLTYLAHCFSHNGSTLMSFKVFGKHFGHECLQLF
jgi:hypothetical protein